MFLGGTSMLLDEDILCIVPRESTQLSRDTRRCIFAAAKGRMERVSGVEKCYILSEREGRFAVHTSPISSERLVLRERDDR